MFSWQETEDVLQAIVEILDDPSASKERREKLDSLKAIIATRKARREENNALMAVWQREQDEKFRQMALDTALPRR